MEPLPIRGGAGECWRRAVLAVLSLGGEVEADDGQYLRATFTSRFFKFVDDLELSLDADSGVIHVRCAARTGFYDLGVNRRRVGRLRGLYLEG